MSQVDLYLRLSVDREGKDSLERQESDLRDWATREGLTVRTVWADSGKSGYKNIVREQFDAAIRAVTSGEVAALAVWKLDRLSRRGAGQVGLVLDQVEEAGGRLHFLRDSLDSTVPGHRMVIVMVSEQARAESANTSLRVRSKIAADASAGIPKGGTRSWGYELDGVTPRESEAVHIREAVRRVLEEGASVWSIATEWNRLGLRTDGMGRTRNGRIAPPVWTTTTVRQMLVRPRNAGVLVHQGIQMPTSQIVPLVTRADWEAVCAAVKGKPQAGPRPQYLLGGIMECTCGARMQASKSITARRDGTRHEYGIYRCRLYGQDKSQRHVNIARSHADAAVRDWIVESIGLGEDGPVVTPDQDRLTEIRARLTALSEEEARGTDALLEGVGDVARIKGRLKALASEREVLSRERDDIQSRTSHSAALAEYQTALSTLPDLAPDAEVDAILAQGFAAWDALSMESRRSIIRGRYRVTLAAGGRGPERVTVEKSEPGTS